MIDSRSVIFGFLLITFPAQAHSQTIILWPGETPPEGWYFCDGAELEARKHPALFKAIGTTYGGEGEKFALPNLSSVAEKSRRGESPIRYIISDGHVDLTAGTPGEITWFGFSYEPLWQLRLEGREYQEKNPQLQKVIGSRFAGYKTQRMYLPDLRLPITVKEPHPDDVRKERSYLVSQHPTPLIREVAGSNQKHRPDPMREGAWGYAGQIVAYAGAKLPEGWIACRGQLLSVSEDYVLFSLLGDIYGGDGRKTLGVPDLQTKSKRLKKAAGLDESAPELFFMIASKGMWPARE